MATSRACDACGSLYQPLRTTSRYCSGRCRKRAQRNGLARPAQADREAREDQKAPPAEKAGLVTAMLIEELRAAGRERTTLGQAALVLARRMDAAHTETGAAVSSLNKELRAAREAALAKAGDTGDALDEIARKREERIARAGRG